jgi:hypothetical protein
MSDCVRRASASFRGASDGAQRAVDRIQRTSAGGRGASAVSQRAEIFPNRASKSFSFDMESVKRRAEPFLVVLADDRHRFHFPVDRGDQSHDPKN